MGDQFWIRVLERLPLVELSAMAATCRWLNQLACCVFAVNNEHHPVELDMDHLVDKSGSQADVHIAQIITYFGGSMSNINIKYTADTGNPYCRHVNRALLNSVILHCRRPVEKLQFTNVIFPADRDLFVDLRSLTYHLTALNITNSYIPDHFLFGKCTKLLHLTVNGSSIDHVTNCVFRRLQTLVLRALSDNPCELRPKLNRFLRNHHYELRRITVIDLPLSMISASISQMRQLIELHVEDATGSILPLVKLRGIQRFTLKRHKYHADEVEEFLERSNAIDTLQSLDLWDKDPINSVQFLHNVWLFQNLRELKFLAGLALTDAFLCSLNRLPNLFELCIRQAVRITWNGLMPLVGRLMMLRQLTVTGMRMPDEEVHAALCAIYLHRSWILIVKDFEDQVNIGLANQRRIYYANDVENADMVQLFQHYEVGEDSDDAGSGVNCVRG